MANQSAALSPTERLIERLLTASELESIGGGKDDYIEHMQCPPIDNGYRQVVVKDPNNPNI